VVQFGIDADAEVQSLLVELVLEPTHPHRCLDRGPCPPADLFAKFLQERNR
jgi:hypothetical protein